MYCIVPYAFLSLCCDYKNTKDMKLENTKAQMRKGVLELCVLSIISGTEMYPSDIIKKLKEAKLIVVEGTLYPLLSRLKNAELLEYNWKESKSGPPRKYYSLTEEGSSFLDSLKETWEDLNHAVKTATKSETKKKATTKQ